jgi:hypothetical protein
VLEARVVAAAWVEEYNTRRPHRGLGIAHTTTVRRPLERGDRMRHTPLVSPGPVSNQPARAGRAPGGLRGRDEPTEEMDQTAGAAQDLRTQALRDADRQARRLDVRSHLSQALMSLIAAALLLAIMLALVDLLAADVFAVMFVPFLVLAVVHMRPLLHWIVFVGSIGATALTLIRIEQSDSSTAGFGVIVVPLLLVTAIVFLALIERVAAGHAQHTEPKSR